MQLSLQGLDLKQLQGTFGDVWLQLTNLLNLQGAIETQEGTTLLQNLSASSGELLLKLPLSSGEVNFSAPLLLEGLVADLQNPSGKPLLGTASLAALKVPRFSAKLPALTLDAEANATTVLFERLPIGDSLLFFQTLTLQHLSAKNSSLEASLGAVTLHKARLSFGAGAFQLTCEAIELVDVSLRTPELLLRADAIHISEGVSLSKDAVSLGQITSEALHISATFSSDKKDPSDKKPGPVIDLRILDGIEGKLDADIDVDVRVPVIGNRHAVHKIRLPIEYGAINFNELKNNLAFIESSVIDFAVVGEQLILQRDLPLIPDKPKPIIFWSLDNEGQKLAAKEKISLRALTSARLAKDDEDDAPKKEKKSPLKHLIIKDLALDVVLFSQEAFTLDGVIPKVSLGQLALTGNLQHIPGQEPTPLPLALNAKNLALSLYQLAVGARFLSVRSVEVGALRDSALMMTGLKPSSLQLTLASLKLRGVSL